MNTLKAEKRSLDVKAKRLRREGYVVGNVFGREMKESIPVKMLHKRKRKQITLCLFFAHPVSSPIVFSVRTACWSAYAVPFVSP